MIYKAIAEVLKAGETETYGLEPFRIKKGHYNSFYIKDYMENPNSIRESFQLLLGQDEIDPEGYCIE